MADVHDQKVSIVIFVLSDHKNKYTINMPKIRISNRVKIDMIYDNKNITDKNFYTGKNHENNNDINTGSFSII